MSVSGEAGGVVTISIPLPMPCLSCGCPWFEHARLFQVNVQTGHAEAHWYCTQCGRRTVARSTPSTPQQGEP
jgi:hypothetical protein